MIKENTEQRNEYEKKLQAKNTQINQLNTDLANKKTEISITKEQADNYADQNQELHAEVMKLQKQL